MGYETNVAGINYSGGKKKKDTKLNTGTSVVDYLKSKGQDSSMGNREKIAKQYGISGYEGLYNQNIDLLDKLKTGQPTTAVDKGKAVVPSTANKGKTNVTAPDPVVANPINPLATNAISSTGQNAPAAYQSPYGDQLNALINKVVNRGQFEYDPASDPTFQSYSQQYQQKANLGLRDTMGSAAALSGGYGNTYATQAGQQTYDGYMGQLNNMIPELYDAALSRYQTQNSNDLNNLSALQNMENSSYGQYRDTVGDYQTDRSFSYGQERDNVADNQWQQSFDTGNEQWQQEFDTGVDQFDRQFDYGKERDTVADGQWNKNYNLDVSQFKHGQSQDAINNAQQDRNYGLNQQQFEYNKGQDKLDRQDAMDKYLNDLEQTDSKEVAQASEERIGKYSGIVNNMINATVKEGAMTSPKYSVDNIYDYLDDSGLSSDEIAIIVNDNYELRKYAESLLGN